MPTGFPLTLFELNLDNPTHVGDAGHADFIRRRRERIRQWLTNISAVPPIEAKNQFQGFVSYSLLLMKEMRDLTGTLKEYASRPELKRPINILLQAPPGSGKSTLVKSICKDLALPRLSKLIEINFSNLLTPGDVIPVFEHLKILQDNGILPVVFFDEVDVPEWSVYQYMLMPMWDGAFIAHGQRLEFKSSIFFFAASSKTTPNPHAVKLFVLNSEEEWLAKAHDNLRSWLQSPEAPHKASDFFSRIDFYLFMPPTQYHFIAPFNQHPDIYWQDEETIQIAKYIIKSQFKQVKEVDTRVLAFLSGALLDSKRELERIVFLSTVSEKDERFQWDHLPKELLSGGPWFQKLAQEAPKFINLE